MIIVNADDWGQSRRETDRILTCFRAGRINSVSAMVFMEDAERAAETARAAGMEVGLHLNLSHPFNGRCPNGRLKEYQGQVASFLRWSRYSNAIFHPGLRRQFRHLFAAQYEEFVRLYGKPPAHIDGHQHHHLCGNMILDDVMPAGLRVRRNISFRPGEKGVLNRTYRGLVDWWLARRHPLTDFFFEFPGRDRAEGLAEMFLLGKTASVEIMVHPGDAKEFHVLMSDSYLHLFEEAATGAPLPLKEHEWEASRT